MNVRFKVFESTSSSWEELFQEAADFASTIGSEKLVSISHSSGTKARMFSTGTDNGVVTVWYWDEND